MHIEMHKVGLRANFGNYAKLKKIKLKAKVNL